MNTHSYRCGMSRVYSISPLNSPPFFFFSVFVAPSDADGVLDPPRTLKAPANWWKYPKLVTILFKVKRRLVLENYYKSQTKVFAHRISANKLQTTFSSGTYISPPPSQIWNLVSLCVIGYSDAGVVWHIYIVYSYVFNCSKKICRSIWLNVHLFTEWNYNTLTTGSHRILTLTQHHIFRLRSLVNIITKVNLDTECI